jgi:hypothetical protein
MNGMRSFRARPRCRNSGAISTVHSRISAGLNRGPEMRGPARSVAAPAQPVARRPGPVRAQYPIIQYRGKT